VNILSLNWGQLDPVLNLETKWGQIRDKIRDKPETTFLLEQSEDKPETTRDIVSNLRTKSQLGTESLLIGTGLVHYCSHVVNII
jgi:hypothetical protein